MGSRSLLSNVVTCIMSSAAPLEPLEIFMDPFLRSSLQIEGKTSWRRSILIASYSAYRVYKSLWYTQYTHMCTLILAWWFVGASDWMFTRHIPFCFVTWMYSLRKIAENYRWWCQRVFVHIQNVIGHSHFDEWFFRWVVQPPTTVDKPWLSTNPWMNQYEHPIALGGQCL